MKTILDKVDPKYLECATGLCEHSIHSFKSINLAINIISLRIPYRKSFYIK